MAVTLVDRAAGGFSRMFSTFPTHDVPDGSMIDLPGRGSTFVTDSDPDSDKPAILLLHAVITTGLLSWYSTIPQLRTRFRVITMDQRWHGRGIRSEEFRLADCADDAVALADVLGIDRFLAAGFSMGGGTAQLIWRRHPDRVRGLVLASTGPYFGSSTTGRGPLDRLVGAASAKFSRPVRSVREHVLDERGLSDGAWAVRQVRSARLSHISEMSRELGRFESRSWLAEIDVPTAVCVTTRDRVIPVARQQLLVDGIPGARRFDISGGHACCVLESDAFVPPFLTACSWTDARSDQPA